MLIFFILHWLIYSKSNTEESHMGVTLKKSMGGISCQVFWFITKCDR